MRKQDGSNTRFSKNGTLLIPQTWLGRGFIRLTQNSTQVVENLPLEHLVHEPDKVHYHMLRSSWKEVSLHLVQELNSREPMLYLVAHSMWNWYSTFVPMTKLCAQ